MVCRKCGNLLSNGNKFCKFCGTPTEQIPNAAFQKSALQKVPLTREVLKKSQRNIIIWSTTIPLCIFILLIGITLCIAFWPFIIVVGIGCPLIEVYLIRSAIRNVKKLETETFAIVKNQLVKIEIESGVDVPDTYTFYFHTVDERGIPYQTSDIFGAPFNKANLGSVYYLLLYKTQKGEYELRGCYAADHYELGPDILPFYTEDPKIVGEPKPIL